MARKIIILERAGDPASANFNDLHFRYVLWADVPSARQSYFADANKSTLVKDATAGEKSSITSGAILEHSDITNYPAGTSVANIKADLINKFNDFQNSVNSFNPFQFYGTFYDGSTWTTGGVS
jgi:hypothetical protein